MESKTVREAVRALLARADAMGVERWSPEALVPVMEDMRRRPLRLNLTAQLPDSVTAVWHVYEGYDVIAVEDGWPTLARSIAHEYGHMMLGHGAAPADILKPLVRTVGVSGLHMMFTRRCGGVRWNAQEAEAEDFAALLCREVQRRAGYRDVRQAGVLADAFG